MGCVYCYVSLFKTEASPEPPSIEEQKDWIERWSEHQKRKLMETFIDIDDRPFEERVKFHYFLEYVERGDCVVVWNVWRVINKRTGDLARLIEILKKKGAFLVCIEDGVDTTTPLGEMIITVIPQIAGLKELSRVERENMSKSVESSEQIST